MSSKNSAAMPSAITAVFELEAEAARIVAAAQDEAASLRAEGVRRNDLEIASARDELARRIARVEEDARRKLADRLAELAATHAAALETVRRSDPDREEAAVELVLSRLKDPTT